MRRLALALTALFGFVLFALHVSAQDTPDVAEHCHNVAAGTTGPPIFCEVPTSTTTTTSSTTPTTSTTAPATTTTPSTSVTSPPTTSTTVAPTVPEPPPSTSTPLPTTTEPSNETTTTLSPPPGGESFVEDFSTAAGFYDRFVTHVGNYCTPGTSCRPEDHGDEGNFWPGDHNTACQGPTTTRTIDISNHSNMFWWCAPGGADTGHVMLGQNTTGYGIVSLSPNRTFHDIERVCWDVNLTDLGGGKWFNLVIVPEAFYLAHPNTNPTRVAEGEGPYRMDYTSPGFNDDNAPGDFNIQGGATFGLKQFRGDLSLWTNNATDSFVWSTGGGHVTSDKAARWRHCLTDTPAGLVVSQQQPGGTVSWPVAGVHLPAGAVRVVWQDDTYDAVKHDGIPANKTWHLDNITID